MNSTTFGIWLSGLLTIALYSYLLGDNKIFKLAERIYVGAAAGHALTMAYANVNDLALKPIISDGQWVSIIPILVGLCFFGRLSEKYRWIARYPVAFIVGIGTGVSLRGLPSAQILTQIRATMIPIRHVNHVIMILGVVSTIWYFVFTVSAVEESWTGNKLAKLGRWFMMVTFGVGFATSAASMVARGVGAVTNILRMFNLAR